MAPAQRTGRARHRLILLTLVAITLLTVDLRGFEAARVAQGYVRDLLHPVNSLVSSIFSPVGDIWNSIFQYDDLEAENAELQQQLDALSGAAIQAEADNAAYRQLLDSLDLPYALDLETVAARVERGPVGNFASDVVTINKGNRHGLAEGMTVVTGAGLVGRVDRVDGVTSTVQLLSDPSLLVGVRLVSTNDVGLGHAVPGEPGVFIINQGPNWPQISEAELLPEIGSAVVTDADSRYTADVPIGRVIEVRPASDELSLEVLVQLANDVEDLAFVSVLITEQRDELPLLPVVPNTSVPLDLDPDLLNDPNSVEQGSDGEVSQ
ncbi:MAG: rod shape-determining protein MreC [Acidimicrobiaceae bacterium]|nr:rod shape-determining protein MreC [Acidimicrobiaceae bacterium]